MHHIYIRVGWCMIRCTIQSLTGGGSVCFRLLLLLLKMDFCVSCVWDSMEREIQGLLVVVLVVLLAGIYVSVSDKFKDGIFGLFWGFLLGHFRRRRRDECIFGCEFLRGCGVCGVGANNGN
eukprot:GHVO01058041.1.p2 GENE.GHVO01058041.1~~GHVO01058041.1.p2  ORF type:complete len:121 (-),score=17.10 GHVO01058041.1:651-1013(-)